MVEGKNIREIGGEEECRDNTDKSSSYASGASGVSTTRNENYSMGGTDGASGGARGWRGVNTSDAGPRETQRTGDEIKEEGKAW